MKNLAGVLAAACCICLILTGCSTESNQFRDWAEYLGDPSRSHFSTLAQITPANVHRLEVAWTYSSRDKRADNRSQIQCNPIVVDGRLFATSAQLKVFALDAGSGRESWSFDPFAGQAEGEGRGVNRGVAYWEEGTDRRILFSAGSFLYALNADTGQPVAGFGQDGKVDLREGLGRDVSRLYINVTTPGAVFRDLLILGSRVGEGPGPSAPGFIRAYDTRTGTIRWTFRTIPQPGEKGSETWPPGAWELAGGANCWSGFAVDPERQLVFMGTGSPTFDFWGGNRKGQNLFGNSIVALNANTGERVWHFQVVHHDLWDRDLPAPPNLVTVNHDGRRTDAVAQITKSGHLFLLDRETGRPLFPVEERPVPKSDLRGEEAWPTQPFPVKPPPFARQNFGEEDVTDLSAASREHVLQRLRATRSGGQFVPPSTEGTVIFPGFDGGGEWGGAALDPNRGILYVNSNEMPWILTMVDVEEGSRDRMTPGRSVYAVNCGVCHGPDLEGDQQNTYPGLKNLAGKSSEEDVRRLTVSGKGFMPSFAHLSPDELNVLIDFLFGRDTADIYNERRLPDVPYTYTGYNRFLDPEGYPAVKPPWGTLTAIDLNRGEFLWQVPLGEIAELTARGIPPTGTENYGGPVVTSTGLLFIGATKDEMFRAIDTETGRTLWETRLPAGGYATPATYEVNGKQFVVIAAGGGKMGTKSGDTYVAFALPD